MSINTPTGWDEELKSRLEGLTPEEKSRLFEMLKQDKERDEDEQKNIEPNPELFWDKEAILKDLKENHVKIEENVENFWKEWKIVHIDLPAVWEFEWFKFDCFISNDSFNRETLGKERGTKKTNKNLYSVKEISRLLQAINKYMKALGVDTDWDMDYEKISNKEVYTKSWDIVKNIFGLDWYYWLSDETLNNDRWYWCCVDNCYFQHNNFVTTEARLLLKLSD